MGLEYRWFLEWLTPTEGAIHGVKRWLKSFKTPFQEVDLMELHVFGKTLAIDGKIQSTLFDEWIYHEALVHPAMIAHPAPRRVLILGGGEGATLREVLKHRSVDRVVVVDIDEQVIEIARRELWDWHRGSFDDPRTEVVIEDGRKFLSRRGEVFDVIIGDLTDPAEGGASQLLYTKEFYTLVRGRLAEDGIFVTQATSPYMHIGVYAVVYNTIRSVFGKAEAYTAYVPSFYDEWGFVVAGQGKLPGEMGPEEVDRLLGERIGGELRYYDGVTHVRMFSLPKHVRRRLEEEKRIATDANPVALEA